MPRTKKVAKTKKYKHTSPAEYHISPPSSELTRKQARNIAHAILPYSPDDKVNPQRNPFQRAIATFTRTHHRSPTEKELKQIRKKTALEYDEEDNYIYPYNEYDSASSDYSQRYDSDDNIEYYKKPPRRLVMHDNNFILEKSKHKQPAGMHNLIERVQKENSNAKDLPKMPKDVIGTILSFDGPLTTKKEQDKVYHYLDENAKRAATIKKLPAHKNYKNKRKANPLDFKLSIKKRGTVK